MGVLAFIWVFVVYVLGIVALVLPTEDGDMPNWLGITMLGWLLGGFAVMGVVLLGSNAPKGE